MSAIMGQPKPQASLSSSLLARKGQARPAMRPQGFSGFGNLADAIDDLGWNDMGQGGDAPQPATQPALRPVTEALDAPAPMPEVLREREELQEELAAPKPKASVATAPAVTPQPAPTATPRSHAALTRIGRQVQAKRGSGKTAFTLRLDADRHLRLRLATAICDRSAQQLVTEALDAFLANLPEIEELASSLPKRRRAKQGE
jgi:hypothetical protein